MKFRIMGLLTLLSVTACGDRQPPMVVPIPEQLTLFSLDPIGPLASVPEGVESFQGYRVLGKLEITDPQQRQDIVMAINRGIAEGGEQAKCFDSRHGFRTVTEKSIRDYVICFHCGNYYDYPRADGLLRSISKSPQPLLNSLLKNAGVPLDQE